MFDWLLSTKLGRTVILLCVVITVLILANVPKLQTLVVLGWMSFVIIKALLRNDGPQLVDRYWEVVKPVFVFVLKGLGLIFLLCVIAPLVMNFRF